MHIKKTQTYKQSQSIQNKIRPKMFLYVSFVINVCEDIIPLKATLRIQCEMETCRRQLYFALWLPSPSDISFTRLANVQKSLRKTQTNQHMCFLSSPLLSVYDDNPHWGSYLLDFVTFFEAVSSYSHDNANIKLISMKLVTF